MAQNLKGALKGLPKNIRAYLDVTEQFKPEVVISDFETWSYLYRPFSEAGFIDDLRTAAGMVASAGFTLMGEAMYLHRPMLAVPIGGQFEQVLNARYLGREGYGLAADAISESRLGEFIERLPDFERNLAGYRQDGNRDLLESLAKTLAG